MGWISKNEKAESYEARYRDPNGRERSRSFRTKAEARRFLNEVETAKHRGSWIDPALSKILFASWAEEHAKTRVHLRPATQARAESLMKAHVLPRFGDSRLGTITQVEVQAWVNSLIGEGLSASTAHGCYRLFSQVMDSAVAANIIPSSPCRQIALPLLERVEMRFLNPQELQKLAGVCDGYATLCRRISRPTLGRARRVKASPRQPAEAGRRGCRDPDGGERPPAQRLGSRFPQRDAERASRTQTGRSRNAGVRREGRRSTPSQQLP
jgi:Phage integrase, N-terminal SAM-like domain